MVACARSAATRWLNAPARPRVLRLSATAPAVLEVRGEQVRIGIRAPKNVSVHRKEVYEQILDENKGASDVNPDDVPG